MVDFYQHFISNFFIFTNDQYFLKKQKDLQTLTRERFIDIKSLSSIFLSFVVLE